MAFLETVQQLEESIQATGKRIDTLVRNTECVADSLKSFKDLKREIRGFFSIKGYSTVFGTSSLIKKVFGLLCFVVLFSVCVCYADQNLRGFNENSVFTQIKIKENGTMAFPAVTVCLQERRLVNTTIVTFALNLSSILSECFFENTNNICTANDFEYFQVWNKKFGTQN